VSPTGSRSIIQLINAADMANTRGGDCGTHPRGKGGYPGKEEAVGPPRARSRPTDLTGDGHSLKYPLETSLHF
jgi:hypothetical protein